MKRTTLFLFFLVTLLATSGFGQASPLLYESPLNVPEKFAKYFDTAFTVQLPEKFRISVFYTGTLASPRLMAFDPRGRLCVSDRYNNAILALPDKDNDGIADTSIVIARDFEEGHSIAFFRGDLYVAASTKIHKYSAPDEDGVYQQHTIFIDSIPNTGEGLNHYTRTILFDEKKNSVYISIGAACNACKQKDTNRATIMRYNLDGTGREIYATGLRNAIGLALDSAGELWATIAERNSQGEDVPHELVTRIKKGGFYGWPLAFGNKQWDDFTVDSEYKSMLPLTYQDSLLVENMQVPDATVDAHSTPMGIAYYDNEGLPAEYKGSLFVSTHGSSPTVDGRLVANGSKIVTVSKQGDQYTVNDFCTGFLTDTIGYERWARPCGMVHDNNRKIYFSSDHESKHSKAAIFVIEYLPNGAVRSSTACITASVECQTLGNQLQVHVRHAASEKISTPEFYSILGVPVSSTLVNVTTNDTETIFVFNASNLANGIYLCSVPSDASSLTKVFSIAR